MLEEVETEYALKIIDKQAENKVVIPPALDKSEGIALMIADNIDNLENTLTGSGTSHRVNSILVMKRKYSEKTADDEFNVERPQKRICRRSLPTDIVTKYLPEYYGGKRVGPGVLRFVQNLEIGSCYHVKADKQRKLYLAWIEIRKMKTHPLLLIPGWTGFNIIIRQDIVIMESTIGYLDTLDSSATDIKTAYEVLCRGCEICDRLQLECVVCVFDQAFYAKAMDVMWKKNDLFKGLIVMMGGFHILMMILGVIGTRFGDAGLKDLAVQSEVIVEGSIENVLAGKQYNRAVRLHKINYEAMMRLLVDAFESSFDDTEIGNFNEDEKKEIENLKTNLCQEECERVLNSTAFSDWIDHFSSYITHLKVEGSDLAKFWISYLELCELLLNLIYATRTGNWELYLLCIGETLPWV